MLFFNLFSSGRFSRDQFNKRVTRVVFTHGVSSTYELNKRFLYTGIVACIPVHDTIVMYNCSFTIVT